MSRRMSKKPSLRSVHCRLQKSSWDLEAKKLFEVFENIVDNVGGVGMAFEDGGDGGGGGWSEVWTANVAWAWRSLDCAGSAGPNWPGTVLHRDSCLSKTALTLVSGQLITRAVTVAGPWTWSRVRTEVHINGYWGIVGSARWIRGELKWRLGGNCRPSN